MRQVGQLPRITAWCTVDITLNFKSQSLLYAFFWVIPRRLNLICRRFGTHCLSDLHRWVGMKMEQSVPKRRHIKFRRRGFTQKKVYNIQNTAKVWNQEVTHYVIFSSFLYPSPQSSNITNVRSFFTARDQVSHPQKQQRKLWLRIF